MKVLLLLTLFLTSCGLHQMVIPNLDLAVHHKLRKDLDLNRSQQRKLNGDIDLLLNDLRPHIKKHALPLVEKLDTKKLKEADAKKVQLEIASLYFHSTERLSKLMVNYLVELNNKQKKHYFSVLEKEIKDIQKRVKKYDTKLVKKRFKFFTGDLNQNQDKRIESFKDYLVARNQELLIRKQHFFKQMQAALNLDDKASKRNELTKLYQQYNQMTYDYFKSEESLKAFQMALDIFNMADKDQVHYLDKKLHKAEVWTRYLSEYQF
jgi:hypothetical protein